MFSWYGVGEVLERGEDEYMDSSGTAYGVSGVHSIKAVLGSFGWAWRLAIGCVMKVVKV